MAETARLELVADSSEIKTATSDLAKLSGQAVKTEKDAESLSSGISSASKNFSSFDRTVSNASRTVVQFGETIKGATGLARALGISQSKLDSETEKLNAELQKNKTAAKSAADSTSVLAAANREAANDAKAFGNSTGAATKGLGAVGRSAGQAAIQIQQFFGQIEGGQSKLTALSQQSADFGFVIGAPLAGAVVSITAALVSLALAAENAAADIESLRTAADNISKVRFDNLVAAEEAIRNVTNAADREKLAQFDEQILKATVSLENQALTLERLAKARQEALDDVSDTGSKVFGVSEAEQKAQTKANREYNEALQQQAKTQAELNAIIAQRENFAKGIEDETAAIEKQATLIERVLAQAQFQVDILKATSEERANLLAIQALGNGATQQEIEQLAALYTQRQLLIDQQRDAQSNTVEGQGQFSGMGSIFGGAIGTDAYGEQLQMESDFLASRVDLNIRAEQDIAKARKQAYSAALSAMGSFFSQGTAASKAFFLVQKGIQAVEAWNSAQAGAALALATLPPPLGESVAAKRLAFGKVTALSIAASAIGGLATGGGGGGGGSISAGSTTGGANVFAPRDVPQQRTVENTAATDILNELRQFSGDELLPVEYTRRLVASIAEVERQGGI